MNGVSDFKLREYFEKQSNAEFTSAAMWKLYRNSLVTHKFSENRLEKLAVFNSVVNSVYQVHVFRGEKILFEFGIEIVSKSDLRKSMSLLPPAKTKIRFVKEYTVKDIQFSQFVYMDGENLILVLVPTKTVGDGKAVHQYIQYIAGIYHYRKSSKSNVLNIPALFEEHFRTQIEKVAEEKPDYRMLAAVYRLEDLSSYCRIMGEQFTHGIVKEINRTIRSFISKDDLIYTFSHSRYLVVTFNENNENAMLRLKNVLFRVQELIIRYNVDLFEFEKDSLKNPDFIERFLVH